MKLNRISLQLIGLWPEVKENSREKFICNLRVLVILLLFVIGVLVPYIHSMTRIRKNNLQVIEHLQFLLPTSTCIIRIIIFWWKKKAVTELMGMIAEDWLKARDAQERDTMIKRAQRARVIIIIAYFTMILGYFCIVCLPVFGISITYTTNLTVQNKMLPLQAYHIYHLTERPQYELTYVSQAISMFFAVMAYTGIDSFLGLLVFHVCGQLDILTARLMCLDKLMKFHNGLKKCVTHHIRLLRAVNVIEDTYNIMLLALFLNFGILFAFYGFFIVSIFGENNDISITRLPFCICNVINIFFHMCLYCVVGEILVVQSNKIHYAVYNQEWYSLDTKDARVLIILMIKSNISPYITAGKVFPITMVTFCNLVKTSAGFISVLFTSRT